METPQPQSSFPSEKNLENQNFKKPTNSEIKQSSTAGKKFLKLAGGFLVLAVIAAAGFFVWNKYFSPQAKIDRQTQKNYQKYLNWQTNYEKAMKEDTYGGKTPEETLKMFIEALKKEDIELASKYFVRREDGSYDPKWKEGLEKTKQTGKLAEVVDLLLKAKPAGSVMEGYFGFEIRNTKNELISDINMRFNKYSGIWKIESL